SAPFMLYQAWAFVAPGLFRHEKRLALPLLLASVLLFYLGLAFAYFVLLPAMFAFLTTTVPEGVVMTTDISAYLSFVLVMGLASGIAFEVPVAVLVAMMLGWVTPAQLSEWRGYVIVAIAILAALLTPPDGLSMVLLMLPMWLLYEAGLVVGRLLVRPRAEEAAG
ncbi:twin-arginine translocase subunit TatC, partial [Silanimonas lenta]|uniref:twin-arginine translocase subunit TatC n=1 Tax=Silanimonas lenta TaxID=265429 RepID=UPI002FDFAA77